MPKAVLIINMPESCDMCDFVDNTQPPIYGKQTFYCNAPGIGDDVTNCITRRPDWCPLLELPEKKEELPIEEYEFGSLGKAFTSGWNACLDEILKLIERSKIVKDKDFVVKHADGIQLVVFIVFLFLLGGCIFDAANIVTTCPTRWQDESADTLSKQGYTICEIKENGRLLVTIAGISDTELGKYNNKSEDTISVMKIRVNGEISEVVIPINKIKELQKSRD